MKQKKILKTVLMIGIAFFIILIAKEVKAASVSISASKTSVTPGESVTITVSSDCTGRINLSASGGSLSSDRVWIEGNSQSVTLKTSSAGTITITATPETLSTSAGEEVNLGAKSCSVKVAANTSGTTNNNNNNNNNNNTNTNIKSSVATLANLGIRPNDFSGFTPSKKSYAATVPNNIESVEIYASKGQSGQTISGTGTKSLKEGENTFTITVTAEDGKTTNQYTLTVTREAKEDEEKPEETEKPDTENPTQEKFGLSTLIMSGVSLDPKFSTDVFEYKVKLTEDKEKLDIQTVSTDEKAKVEVTGNENLQEGENIITILVTDESGEKTATYQIIVEKNLVNQEEIDKQKEQEEKDKQMKMILIGGAGAVLIIIIAIVIIVKRRRNKQYAEEFSIPYTGLNEEEEKEEIMTEKDSEIESTDPLEIDDKEKLRQEFLNQSFTEFEEEEKPRKNRHSKGKRFK